MNEAEQIIRTLELEAHPEGGFFKEVYRSEGIIPNQVLPQNYTGDRNYVTSIYFLLTSDAFSAFHKINQEETWHFYKGSALMIHMINEAGMYSKALLGSSLQQDEHLQYTVPGGVWFAAEVLEKNSFALVGCTVAPGFDFSDFELANREVLKNEYPDHAEIIHKFTRL